MLDLVHDGSSWEEVVALAKKIEAAGATIINTGIGWHEARVPTIATMVPRGGFSWVTKRLMGEVGIPLITTNRINTPEKAESILEQGHADMISMARPFLADPFFVKKAREQKAREINTCIACNQACLDHIFERKQASCLVNPRAGYETSLRIEPAAETKKVAVVGAGPAGLAAATTAARRGHQVTLFEGDGEIGGQFNMAKRIPGKEEFHETIRYFRVMLDKHGVEVRLNQRITSQELIDGGFDHVVLATGVTPRRIQLEGIDHPKVLGYIDVLRHGREVGSRAAIIGAGGIGFDVAEFLTHTQEKESDQVAAFAREWGIDQDYENRGGLMEAKVTKPGRTIYLCQRSTHKPGANLGKTTGWIHRSSLRKKDVNFLSGVQYRRIDDRGLHLVQEGRPILLDVDHVIVCAGQEPLRDLLEPLQNAGCTVHLVGGSDEARELDAKRAIDQATRLAAGL